MLAEQRDDRVGGVGSDRIDSGADHLSQLGLVVHRVDIDLDAAPVEFLRFGRGDLLVPL